MQIIESRFEKHLPKVEKFQEEYQKDLQAKINAVRNSPPEKIPYKMEEMEQWATSLEGEIKALSLRLSKIEDYMKGITF